MGEQPEFRKGKLDFIQNVYENTNPKSNLRKCEYYKPLLNYFEQTDCRIHWIQQSKVS